jgi:thiamine kinase-like enzyme
MNAIMEQEGTFTYLGERSFEEMNLPPILYKYRDWNDPYHKRVITKRELYFSPPNTFEDEFDCKIPVRYDLLTPDDIFEKYLKESKELHPNYNRQQHRKFAHDWQRKGLLTNKKRIEKLEEEFFKNFTNKFGILCLTPYPDNEEMWRKYSVEHTGFCVGFHTIPLLSLKEYSGGGSEVNYVDELPILRPFDDLDKNHFLQIYSKLRKWEFEKEYRITKINIQDRGAIIPENIFAEVILGARMTNTSKEELIICVTESFSSLPIKQAIEREGRLIIEPLL